MTETSGDTAVAAGQTAAGGSGGDAVEASAAEARAESSSGAPTSTSEPVESGRKRSAQESLTMDSEGEEETVEDILNIKQKKPAKKRRTTKKRTAGKSMFIEDEAAVDEDDEEEDDEDLADELIDDTELESARKSAEEHITRRRAHLAEDERSAQDIANALLQKYSATAPSYGDEFVVADKQPQRPQLIDDDERPETDLSRLARDSADRIARISDAAKQRASVGHTHREAMYPTASDPKLFVVRCRPGQARPAVLRLMQKCFNFESQQTPLKIYSAFAKDNMKDYIYVEADRKDHVLEAVADLGLWKPEIMKLDEMVSAITISRSKVQLKPQQWVRMRHGVYRSDLGQVYDVDHGRAVCIVRLIPRLDLKVLLDELTDDDYIIKEIPKRVNGEIQMDDTGRPIMKEIRRRRPGPRPEAKPFNPDELRQLGLDLRQVRHPRLGEKMWKLKDDSYKDGYLYREVSLTGVQQLSERPSLEELRLFLETERAAQQQSHQSLDMDSISDARVSTKELMDVEIGNSRAAEIAKTKLYRAGDRVILKSGDLRNLVGVVLHVDHSGSVLRIQPKPKDATLAASLPKSLTVSVNDVRKYFENGDHCRALGGRHEGETGFVVSVSDDGEVAKLLSDVQHIEIEVFVQDLTIASETSSGLNRCGQFVLHDLVQRGQSAQSDVGMIIRIDNPTTAVIINHHGKKVTVRSTELIRPPTQRSAIAYDSHQNALEIGDVVQLQSGGDRAHEGTIQHIWKGAVWLKLRSHSARDGGIVWALASRCRRVGGSSARRRTMGGQLNMMPPMSGMSQSTGGLGNNDPVRLRSDRQAKGKLCRITRGKYKGKKGNIVDYNERNARVELHALYKTVAIPSSCIQIIEKLNTTSMHTGGASTRMAGGMTPAWELGGTTPSRQHADDDEWAAHTPAHTSRDDAWGAQSASRGDDPAATSSWKPRSPSYRPDDDARPEEFGSSMDYTTSSYTPYDAPSANMYSVSTPSGGAAGASGSTPYGTSNTPYGTSNTPYGTSSTPYGTGSTPYGTSSTPYGTSSTPYGSGSTPYGGGNTPYGSTPYGGTNDAPSTPYGGPSTPYGGGSGSGAGAYESSSSSSRVPDSELPTSGPAPESGDDCVIIGGDYRGCKAVCNDRQGADVVVKLLDGSDSVRVVPAANVVRL